MKRIQLLSIGAATMLCANFLHAQAPAAATPAAPAATSAPAAGKPYSSGDVQKLKAAAEALQFHVKMGEMVRWKYKDTDKEFVAIASRIHKEAVDYYSPLVDLARAHGVPDKEIPNALSNAGKNQIDKLNKSKPDKWKLEYLELFSKEAKKNARTFEEASRSAQEPDLKEWATKASKIITGQAELLESTYKELKNPKKEAKK
jgi:hypothetical protein